MMQAGIASGLNTNLPVCMESENSENGERAIRGAIVELDDLICSTTRRATSSLETLVVDAWLWSKASGMNR